MLSVIVGVAGYGKADSLEVHRRVLAFVEFASCIKSQRNCQFELIIVEQLVQPSEGPYFDAVIKDKDIDCQYKLLDYPVFNKSWILNVGAKMAIGDTLAFLDADIIFREDYFSLLETAIGSSYLVGWSKVHCLNQKATDLYIKDRKYNWGEHEAEQKNASIHGSAGLVDIFRRGFFFQKLGGWNEAFFQGGGSDNDLVLRAYTMSGEVCILDHTLVHLFHIRQPRPDPNQEMWRITQADANRVSRVILEEGCGDPLSPKPIWARLQS